MNVSQEDVLCTAVFDGDLRLKFLEDIEVSKERLGFVEIVAVLAAPEEGLPFSALNAADIDVPVPKDRFLFGAEVVSDYANNLNVGEVTSGHRKVSSGTSKFALNGAVPGFDGIV